MTKAIIPAYRIARFKGHLSDLGTIAALHLFFGLWKVTEKNLICTETDHDGNFVVWYDS